MSCWISDPWKYYDNILKTCHMYEKWRGQKIIPLHLNGVLENILVCVQFSSKLANVTLCLWFAMQLFIFIFGHLSFIPFLCPNWALVVLTPTCTWNRWIECMVHVTGDSFLMVLDFHSRHNLVKQCTPLKHNQHFDAFRQNNNILFLRHFFGEKKTNARGGGSKKYLRHIFKKQN